MKNRCLLIGALLVIAVIVIFAKSNPAATPFRKIVNSYRYIAVIPAESWIYPGGIIYATKDTATFNEIPDGLKPQPADGTVDFPASKTTKSFSLSALLTGFTSLLSGNPGLGFGHNSTVDFKELDASGTKITEVQAKAILLDNDVKREISSWVKGNGHEAFIVIGAFKTNKFNVTANSKWNVDLSFNGKPVSSCGSSKSDSSSSNTGSPKNATDSTTSSSTDATKSASAKKNAASNSGSASSSQPGAEAHFCYSSDNTLTMNTTAPLVFAVSAYKIVPGDPLGIEPVYALTNTGTAEEGGAAAAARIAAMSATVTGMPSGFVRKRLLANR